MQLLTELRAQLNPAKFINGLNQNQLLELSHEIDAHFYWLEHQPAWFSGETRLMMSTLRKCARKIKKRLRSPSVKPELTEFGSTLVRQNLALGDYRLFEKMYLGNGWTVLAGDDHLHTAHINLQKLQLVRYCEGDVFLISAPDNAVFELEKADLVRQINPRPEKTIIATLISDGDERLEVFAQHFSFHVNEFENTVYSFMRSFTSNGYSGGFWDFYSLSNSGFYMSLQCDEEYQVEINTNQFSGVMSADALSIVCNLFALCLLTEKYQETQYLDLYDQLLDYAGEHKESGQIFGAID